MVFYLKYRPKKISELDSGALVEKLEGILKGNLPENIPHAFLFTGPKGLGKTSTARILAKAINCTNRKGNEIEPCNKCDSCKSINNGSSLDVLEIDAASNRGIDEIRDLREKIRLAPVASLKKVYIIDEVHMLTAEAFNALLKTLEEPPSHVFFILCTTEPQKIPQTIESRSFHIKFVSAIDEDLIHSFVRIAKAEGLKVDKESLAQIAKLSDGSFRDGVKILEELSVSSKNITLALIEKKYKTQSIGKYVTDLIMSFEERDAKKGIKLVSAMAEENVDFKLFAENLIASLHQNLILLAGGEKLGMGMEETKQLIEMLVKSHTSIKYAILPQLPLELTIVEWASVSRDTSQEPTLKNSDLVNSSLKLQESHFVPISIGTSRDKHDKILESLIDRVKKENFSIAGVLRGCTVEKFDKKELILSTKYKFHKERLKEPKIKALIEKLMREISNNEIKFSVK